MSLRGNFGSPNARCLILCIILLVVAGMCVPGLKKLQQFFEARQELTVARQLIPNAESIASMSVSRFYNQGSEIPQFIVPREHVSAILESLKVVRIIDQSNEPIVPWVGLGIVEIETLAGEKFSIHVYRTNLPVGEFGVERGSTFVKCRGGNSEQFANAVLTAYRAFTKPE